MKVQTPESSSPESPASLRVLPGAVVLDRSGLPAKAYGQRMIVYPKLTDAKEAANAANANEKYKRIAGPFGAAACELRIVAGSRNK